MELKNYDHAETRLLQARQAAAALLAADRSNLVWRDQATRIEADLGSLYATTGRRAEAMSALREAQRLIAVEGPTGSAPDAAHSQLIEKVGQLSRRIGLQ
jgi:hypothetical protein